MSEFNKHIDKLIVSWTPKDNQTTYIFSLSYLNDTFAKDQILNQTRTEFPISYIPANNPAGKYNGMLYMDLDDNSLNITLTSPERVKEKLYPTGIEPDKPSQKKLNHMMNIEKLSYKNLFPYIYIKPWPNASFSDLENNFALCCIEKPLTPGSTLNTCKNLDNSFYNQLVTLKSQNDRLGMEKEAVYFINGYNDNKEPVYKKEYKPDLSSLNPFFKNVYLFGKNLRQKEKVTFNELTREVDNFFDSWEALQNDLKNPVNKNEQTKISMSYIALMITFGYSFSWMIDLQIIIITLNLFYKAFACIDDNQGDTEETETDEPDSLTPTPETIHNWIYSTIILPEDIFPLPPIKTQEEETGTTEKEFVIPYSLGKLKTVRYRLHKYIQGEVSKIESVLKGENKTVEERKLNRVEEQTDFEQSEVAAWNNALSESFAGIQSSRDGTLNQKTSTTTYNAASDGTIGGWTVDENPDGGGSNSENRLAKDIINKAAEIITQKVNYHRTQKHLHEHEEKVIHQYENAEGDDDIIGIYRWISKVYKFQTVEYGSRVMLQIYCINPAEYYLKNEFRLEGINNEPVQEFFDAPEIKTPEELGVKTFEDISPNPKPEEGKKYYLDVLEYYEINNFPSPPGKNYNTDKTIDGNFQQEYSSLTIPTDYTPVKANVNITLGDKVSKVTIIIGGKEKTLDKNGTADFELSASDLNGNQLPVQINAEFKEDQSNQGDQTENNKPLYSAVISVSSDLKDNVLNEWKYKIYILLKRGHRQRLKNYLHTLHRRNQYLSSGNANLDKDIILQQLKKKCTEVIKIHYTKTICGSLTSVDDSDKTDQHNLLTGEPAFLQFIEQGLEWDKLTYYLYPGFDNQALYTNHSTEQNFNSFLKSEFARVLVPIRIDYQYSFLFSLVTGWLWPGNDIDSPALMNNVNVFNQIKTDNYKERDNKEESWEVSIPTSLTILQKGSELPEFNGDENE